MTASNGVKIDLTNIIDSIDANKFIDEYRKNAQEELKKLLKDISDSSDREELEVASNKLIELYEQMCIASKEDKDSVQRTLNSYKSIIAAISARHKLDYVNKIIAICKQSAIIAITLAVKFVAL